MIDKRALGCRLCGSRDRISLHHAIPRAIGTRESRENVLNLLPLCGDCHDAYHRGGLKIPRKVFTAEEWAYLCSVELTGRTIEGWLAKHYP